MINTIFSGLAFAGLILTIHLQRHELAESQETFRKERFEDSSTACWATTGRTWTTSRSSTTAPARCMTGWAP